MLLAAAVGIGATLTMDVWGWVLNRAFGMPSPNYCFVGRWVLHMPAGVFRHTSIAAADPKPAECAVGWVAHYLVGVLFAFILAAIVAPGWLTAPTFLPAMVFGLATVVMPFLVMQPAFGQGLAASRTPHPTQARIRSLMNHAVFGVGLYLWALVLNMI